MPAYTMRQQVLSQHVDSTGIVPLPRYFEMANALVERWFDDALDWSFARMHGGDGLGLPIAQCQASFPSASRLGDQLVWRLEVLRIGRSSMDLRLAASCGGDMRVEMTSTAVLADLGVIRARQWPDDTRARATDYLVAKVA
ncbi:acyl-CoA thioesterase [Aestuariicoccus sp. MJ-SS9]|uniref:acyl-CoA thioesterase n=1 Tax=Aestuariicoccus sp. MJ-SS9 TaxID=3079855 RepID=UPI00290A68B0|nr:thioesterase family protein [Aestuariicoccus sp. MJ-SS9]MDU8912121.1 hotdog domain-containing protein [Aestuariicoccus sp. MJ-SS9]